MLIGRNTELDKLSKVLEQARHGKGEALVVIGEAGIGKTALIDAVVTSAHDFTVLRSTGSEAEMELPFASLQELCSPVIERLSGLPEPQRHALNVTFGLASDGPPDRLIVGLALVNLLSQLAVERTVLCVLDDAQWMDQASAQAIAFAARRASGAAVSFLFGTRTLTKEMQGLSTVVLDGLRDGHSRELVDSAIMHRVDERVLERLVIEAHGNPLALLELPRKLTPAQLGGGFGLPESIPLSGRIEESFRRRFRRLPSLSRRLMLIAAAEPTGDSTLIWSAAEFLGIPESAADPPKVSQLLDLRASIKFRHPLVRSAVYSAATARERREVHHALAENTDPTADPDRRAWHRSQSTARPDEGIAKELDESAGRAQSRGGVAAAAAFMERSVELTPDPAVKVERALRAADAKRIAGDLDAALRLANIARRGPLDNVQRARLDVVRAEILFAAHRGNEAPALLLQAAYRLEPFDPSAARDTYLDALAAALFAGRFSSGASADDVARAAQTSPKSAGPQRAPEVLLDGLALLVTEGAVIGTPAIQRALDAFRSDQVTSEEQLRWSWLAGRAAGHIWDYENWDFLTARQLEAARETGALSVLPLTLSTRAGLKLFAGEFDEATSLMEQVLSMADAIDTRTVAYAKLSLAAFRGDEPKVLTLIDETQSDLIERGEGAGVTLAQWATAVLYNGLGRYDRAFASASQALEHPNELWFRPWVAVELIEAASRSSRSDQVAPILIRLAEGTSASGTDWAASIEARCRALLAVGQEAEPLYREAIDRLESTPMRWDLARAQLVYGEWLRRERQTREAREHLHSAEELFRDFGAHGFAERARVELRATGQRMSERSTTSRFELTPQETQISRLVARGATNREIASELFISASTVEYHLHKVFLKVGVRSRSQLARRMLQSDPAD